MIPLPDGPDFDAWRIEPVDPAAFASQTAQQRARHIAGWGLLAPTTHNSVPQRFERHRDGLVVRIDPGAVLPQSDPTGRQANISVGCAIEAVVVAFGGYGWRVSVGVDVIGAEIAPIERCSPEPGQLLALKNRRVVRAEYDPRVSLSEALCQQIRSLSPSGEGVALELLTERRALSAIGKLSEQADSAVLNRHDFARELGRWLLPNSAVGALGMRGREFGLGDAAADRLHQGLTGRGPLLGDEIAALAKGSLSGFRSSSAAIVLTVRDDEPMHHIEVGRLYLRLELLLARHGLSTALHAGLCEVEAYSHALRAEIRTAARPVAVVRVGRPLRPEEGLRPRSARPRLEEVWIAG